MAKYIISYDLRRVRNYEELYECLALWKASRILESMWIAELVGPAMTVRDLLRSCVDGDDALVVVEVPSNADWATWQAIPAGVQKLQATHHNAFA